MFAFGDIAYVWKGILSGRTEVATLHPPWIGPNAVAINTGEYIYQGAQHEGQSGGATSNSCGYAGVSHAMNRAFGYIIPAQIVQKCIQLLANDFSRDCPVDLVTLPEMSSCKDS